jgi:YHS domain-containing protein
LVRGIQLAKLVVILLFLGFLISPISAVTQGNAPTVLGLGGYDPVTYFSEQKPVLGNPKIVYSAYGKSWNFISYKNMTKFQNNPTQFLPVFGGYCPVALSKGLKVMGNFTNYVIQFNQVYLFGSGANIPSDEKSLTSIISKATAFVTTNH